MFTSHLYQSKHATCQKKSEIYNLKPQFFYTLQFMLRYNKIVFRYILNKSYIIATLLLRWIIFLSLSFYLVKMTSLTIDITAK